MVAILEASASLRANFLLPNEQYPEFSDFFDFFFFWLKTPFF